MKDFLMIVSLSVLVFGLSLVLTACAAEYDINREVILTDVDILEMRMSSSKDETNYVVTYKKRW